MDNLSHTLIGALVGETATRLVPAFRTALPESTRRGLFLALVMVGSNLPDLDFLYAGVTGHKLGYLLHHRGHTHTVIGVVLLGLLMWVAAQAWLQRKGLMLTQTDARWLMLVALLGPVLHLSLDALNSYGVHPFWPLYDGWLYGDAIFIVEPLFWAAAAPLLLLLRSRVTRALMGVILLAAVGLSFGTGLVPLPMSIALTVLIAILLAVTLRVSGRVAAMSGLAVSLAVVGMFLAAHQVARRQLTDIVLQLFPEAELLDHVLTPMPVNPLCWEVILVQADDGQYTLRRAMLSLAPAWLPAAECSGRSLHSQTTAPLTAVAAGDSAAIRWYGEFTISLTALHRTVQHCEAAAFMRFARVPWVIELEAEMVVGDLRYDREPGLGFAEFALDPDVTECPRWLPPWIPPRRDLLEKSGSG